MASYYKDFEDYWQREGLPGVKLSAPVEGWTYYDLKKALNEAFENGRDRAPARIWRWVRGRGEWHREFLDDPKVYEKKAST
jgi:hypothetical protein